jgi:hypothetical protein
MTPRVQGRLFMAVVLVTLGLAALFGLIVARPALVGGPAGDPSGGHIAEHFRQPHHRIHDLAFGLLLGTTVLGMLAQVRAPARNVAGQLMAATPILALLLATLATDPRVLSIPWVAVGAPTIVATLLHPALFRSFGTRRPSRPMIALITVTAIPLLAYALSNIALQRSGPGDHAALGHYGYMAAFAFAVVGVGLVSSLRLPGWRLATPVTGALAVLLGSASLVWPDVDGALATAWALAAIAWGAVYVSVGEIVRRTDRLPS